MFSLFAASLRPNSLPVLSSPWWYFTVAGKHLNTIGTDGSTVLRSILDKMSHFAKNILQALLKHLVCDAGMLWRSKKEHSVMLIYEDVNVFFCPVWWLQPTPDTYPRLLCLCAGWTSMCLKKVQSTVLKRAQPMPDMWSCFLGWGAFPQGCS